MLKSIVFNSIKTISKSTLVNLPKFAFGKLCAPKYTQLLLNNEWVDSQSGKTFATENPGTEEKICDIA